MRRGAIGVALALAVAWAAGAGQAEAAQTCRLGKIGELPVTMRGLSPTVTAAINGEPTPFIADSGAFFSGLTPAAAAQHHLKLGPAPPYLRVIGIGGEVRVSVTQVKMFGLAGVDIPNVEFLVGGSEVGGGAAGLIGQNVLHVGDVEYDLAGGAIRLFKPQDCANANLAYWAGDRPVSKLAMFQADDHNRQTVAYAKVNGERIKVLLDTGANTSVLSLAAARRAGIRTDGPGVVAAGYSSGVGRRRVPTWIAPVQSFELGDEQIKTTRLRIGDIGVESADMLLGADFFLSHRVYVSNRLQTVFFTYGGGPVFNLNRVDDGAPGAPPAAPSTPAAPAAVAAAPSSEPTDAEAFSRRGAALAARRDYAKAVADFTHAIELNPQEPRYPRQRAQARAALRQLFLAMADLDTVLKLQPRDTDALIMRAELRLSGARRRGRAGGLGRGRRRRAEGGGRPAEPRPALSGAGPVPARAGAVRPVDRGSRRRQPPLPGALRTLPSPRFAEPRTRQGAARLRPIYPDDQGLGQSGDPGPARPAPRRGRSGALGLQRGAAPSAEGQLGAVGPCGGRIAQGPQGRERGGRRGRDRAGAQPARPRPPARPDALRFR